MKRWVGRNRDWKRRTHHIWRCEVAHDKLVLVGLDDFGDFIGDTLHTHFRKLVVRRDFGRINHVPFFSLELLLDTAIEEECDVRVLLCLCVHVRKALC